VGPYGPGAGFAIGSGERLAARRREAAQTKAFMRRYLGMLPQAMNAMAGGMFGPGQSVGRMNGFGGFRHGASVGHFEESGWEDPTATIPHPFSRKQFPTPLAFTSSRGPACGMQRQSFRPGGDLREDIPRGQGMHRPMRGDDVWEELYARRQLEDDSLDAYGGLGAGHFSHSFDKYRRGSFDAPHSEPFGNHSYHGFGVERGNVSRNRYFGDEADCGCHFDARSAQPHSKRGNLRDSFERSRPENL
jgi:hypothetical protein